MVFGDTLDALGDQAARVQALFITVDPERDTPDKLAEYLANFHPDLIGLTGTTAEIAEAARAYRVLALHGVVVHMLCDTEFGIALKIELSRGFSFLLIAHLRIGHCQEPLCKG